jgi:hypothetical protein
LTIGQSVEASLGGGGDRGRTSTTPQRSMWLAGGPCRSLEPHASQHSVRGPRLSATSFYGKCNLVDIRLIMVSLLIIRRVSL